MADTKIRTDRLSVASLVKSILDATTAGAIQTLLNLVPGVNVQAYDADILTTTNTKTVTNKTINPPSVGSNMTSGGTHNIDTNYDYRVVSVAAPAVTINASSAGRYPNQRVRLILSPSAGASLTWGSGIIAATGITLPTSLTSGKVTEVELTYLRASPLAWLAVSVATEP